MIGPEDTHVDRLVHTMRNVTREPHVAFSRYVRSRRGRELDGESTPGGPVGRLIPRRGAHTDADSHNDQDRDGQASERLHDRKSYVTGQLVSGQHLGPVGDPRHRPADANPHSLQNRPGSVPRRTANPPRRNHTGEQTERVEEDFGPMGAAPHDVCEEYNSN